MAKVAVVYHSGYGHTARLAQAVFEGAKGVAGVEAQIISVADMNDAFWAELAAADAIVFGAPTYMGSLSGDFKKFMDATSKPWFTLAWKDKIAGGFTNSGSQSGDKLNSLVQLMILAGQHGMIWVGLGMMPGNNNSKGSPDDLNRLGSFVGPTSQSNIDQGPEAMRESDLETGRLYGKRIAEVTLRFRK